jgi:WD40 repeat protein
VTGGAKRYEGPLQVWDAVSGQELLCVAESWGRVDNVGFSPDSRLLAAHQQGAALKLWEIPSGKEVFSMIPECQFRNWPQFRFSPDSKTLLVEDHGEKLSFVTFWDIATKRQRGRIEGHVGWLAFTEGSQQLIAWHQGNHFKIVKIELWKLGQASSFLSLVGKYDLEVNHLAVSPDRKTIATTIFYSFPSDRTLIEIRELQTGAVVQEFQFDCNGKTISSVSFSPTGRELYVDLFWAKKRWDMQTESRFWDVSHGQTRQIAVFSGSTTISPDGQWLAVATAHGADLYALPSTRKAAVLQTDEPRLSWSFRQGDPSTVVFSPDNRLIAMSGGGWIKPRELITEWFATTICGLPPSVTEWEPSVRICEVESGRECASLKDCGSVKFSPDSKTLVTLRHGKDIALWDVPVRRPPRAVFALSFAAWLVSSTVLLRMSTWCRRKKVQRACPPGER